MTSQTPQRPHLLRRQSSVRFDTNDALSPGRPSDSPGGSEAYNGPVTQVQALRPPAPTFSNPWGNSYALPPSGLSNDNGNLSSRARLSVGGPSLPPPLNLANNIAPPLSTIPSTPIDPYYSSNVEPRPSIGTSPNLPPYTRQTGNGNASQDYQPAIQDHMQNTDSAALDIGSPAPRSRKGIMGHVSGWLTRVGGGVKEGNPSKPKGSNWENYPDEKANDSYEGTPTQRPGYARSETGVSEWNEDEKEYDEDGGGSSKAERSNEKFDEDGNRIVNSKGEGREHVSSYRWNIHFITLLAKALLTFGAPAYRFEAILNTVARELSIKAHFINFPGIIIASFGDPHSHSNTIRFIKANGGTDLGRITATHRIYRALMHDCFSAKDGVKKLQVLVSAKPIYGSKLRIFFAFGCAAAICPLAFGGSFADMWVAGLLSCVMMAINIKYASENPIMANIFELIMAVVVSVIARGISYINNGQTFCYQAISSGGVVLILPGFLLLLSSLDLANKHMLSGSIKLVYVITYTLFLAFCLTAGSDLFFLADSSARQSQNKATAALAAVETISGSFSATAPAMTATASATASAMTSAATSWNGSFTFTNSSAVSDYQSKIINGCMRDPSWRWYAQPLPSWSDFVLVPVFSVLISLNNMQPIVSKQFVAMVLISIASFLANKYANKYAFSQSEIITTVGAFVVGFCGATYSRLFRGTPFAVNVTGLLFLVPSGLSAAGGLGGTNQGSDNDYFSASLQVAARMIQVGIGITVGLLFSNALVYGLFGKKKITSMLGI